MRRRVMESAKDVNALFNNATLYFPFDGDFVDKITGMQATPLGTVGFVDGQKHRAAHVDNNSGRIQIGKSFDINDFAFSYNFYNERNVHQALIHIQPLENNANLDIYMRPDSTPQSIQVWFYPHGNFVYDIGFESGTWYNIILSRSGTKLRLVINGHHLPIKDVPSATIKSSQWFCIGDNNNRSQLWGSVEDFVFWDRSLSDNEIRLITEYYN